MKQQEYEALLSAIIEIIDEGVQVVGRDGRTLFYNNAMAKMEDTAREEVLGKQFSEAFSQIPVAESTLHRALIENKTTKPLTVKMPDAFAGVPVLAQVGGGGGTDRGLRYLREG